jgi:hypothetical protein
MSSYAPKKSYGKPFETRPDSGNLFAEPVKKTPQSPDYSGTIAINLKDMTAIKVENGLTIIKISGWKNVSQTTGKTYLALKVSRFVPEEQGGTRHENQAQSFPEDDKDVPF